MTEHTLTFSRSSQSVPGTADCSCGRWLRLIPWGTNGALAHARAEHTLALAHGEHVQTEADWDAIEEALSWMPALTGRAVEALARLRGRP